MLGGDRIQGERKEAGVQLAMEDFSSRVPVRTPLIICLIMNQEEMSRYQIQCSH